MPFCLCFSACKNQMVASVDNLDSSVALEIASIDGSQELNNEALSALTLIVKTNIANTNNSNIDESVKRNNNINEEIYNKVVTISSSIKDNILSDNYIITSTVPEKNWKLDIKKTDILKFLKKKKLSLSSIASISETKNKDGNIISINMGGKQIDFCEIEKEFNLPSNKITKINNNKQSISVEGERDISSFVSLKSIEDWINKNRDSYNIAFGR